MEKIIIAAIAENGVIGKDGEIPWHYPEDLKHFRQKTMGNPVVMGSSTYRSLPDSHRPLEGRTNVVLTGSGIEEADKYESVYEANSLEDAWRIAGNHGDRVLIIGGASVYRQTLDEADRMAITEIHDEYAGDTYFPEWDEENWVEVSRDDQEEFSFVEYRRDN